MYTEKGGVAQEGDYYRDFVFFFSHPFAFAAFFFFLGGRRSVSFRSRLKVELFTRALVFTVAGRGSAGGTHVRERGGGGEEGGGVGGRV